MTDNLYLLRAEDCICHHNHKFSLNPKTILFDEPSLGLAPLIVNDVIDMIQRVNRSGISVIVVEQNAKKILTIANRAYVMEQGRIVKSGSGQELASDSSIVEAYLGGRRGK